MIEITNLCFKNILHDINLNIPKDITILYGENGAGKTTLFDCICSINKGYTGEIKGNDSIVYLNQSLYFSRGLKLKDFVSFIFTLEGIKNYKQTFFSLIEHDRLHKKFQDNWDKRIGLMSGGEIKMMYFCVLSYISRDYYIFDEPFSNVDKSGKEFITHRINDLQNKGKGIIITTHENEPLEDFHELNTLTIHDGRIVKE